MNPLYLSLLATFLVGLISLVGLVFVSFKINQIKKITYFLVSLAIGTLLGDAFIHLLPQAYKLLPSTQASLFSLSGILLFFFIEKVLRWRHCHEPNCQDSTGHIVTLNLFGDLIHNFIDGMLIAASFIVDIHLGLATTLAIIVHEIPQEIGDFGILIHHGLSVAKAIKLNFLVSLSSLAGAILVFILGQAVNNLSNLLLPITAGGFIYLAASDLIPELHRHTTDIKSSINQLLFIIFGAALMYLLLFLE